MYKFGNTTEELSIKKVESGIRSIRFGTKTPQEANVGFFLNKIKDSNQGMYDDLLVKYMGVKKEYDEKNS